MAAGWLEAGLPIIMKGEKRTDGEKLEESSVCHSIRFTLKDAHISVLDLVRKERMWLQKSHQNPYCTCQRQCVGWLVRVLVRTVWLRQLAGCILRRNRLFSLTNSSKASSLKPQAKPRTWSDNRRLNGWICNHYFYRDLS